MEREKDDRYYAEKIIYDIDAIIKYAKRVNFSCPSENEQGIDAIDFRLIHMRDLLGSMSERFVSTHPEIKIKLIISMRNMITHDYGNVDFSVYKIIIDEDLPTLKAQLESIFFLTKK